MSKRKYYIVLTTIVLLIPLSIYIFYYSMLVEFFEILFPTQKYPENEKVHEINVNKDNLYYLIIEAKHTIIQIASLVIGVASLLSSILLIIKRKTIIK